ncbi:MAG: right-handed parallel beta-helix repeat-containing protein, partial [Acidimicrobiia bacterium]
MLPVHAGQAETRLARLERRVDTLRDEVTAMETALFGELAAYALRAQDSESSWGRRGSSEDDRILRLQRRVVRLDSRISVLEDAVLGDGAPANTDETPGAVERSSHDARRRLTALERSVKRLERRMRELQDADIASPPPTPSPTADPSTSPASSPTPSAIPPPATCSGVQVTPTSNLQGLVDANPPRTTFCFANGLYRLTDTIRTRDRFPTLDLRAGAVIDGQNGSFIGIDGPDAPVGQPGTIILGGVFQRFGNSNAPSWITPMILRRGGLIDGTEFRENYNVGLMIQGSNSRVSHANVHHNGRYGLTVSHACGGCPGPVGVLIEDSEISFNNTRRLATDSDAGGTKFSAGTDGMIVRRNEVHDNYGAGLWWDGYNTNARVYENVIYDNRNWGIMWELSYGGARIHNNTLTNNGLGDGTSNWFNNVQLLVSCSDGSVGGIEIYE